jgi:hypothetical protein
LGVKAACLTARERTLSLSSPHTVLRYPNPGEDLSAGEDTLCAEGRERVDTKEVPGRAKEILRRIFLSRIFLIVAGVIVLYTAVGFFLVPYLIKQQAIKYVTRSLNRQLTIDDVATNPFTFTLSIRNLDFKEQDAMPILGFKDLFINFELFSSLKNWAFTFALIRLDEPRVNVLMRKDGKLNSRTRCCSSPSRRPDPSGGISLRPA